MFYKGKNQSTKSYYEQSTSKDVVLCTENIPITIIITLLKYRVLSHLAARKHEKNNNTKIKLHRQKCRLEGVSKSFYDMGCVALTLLFLYCRDSSQ
jgi:hypothetical protein